MTTPLSTGDEEAQKVSGVESMATSSDPEVAGAPTINDAQPAKEGTHNFADDIQALKAKILELEKTAATQDSPNDTNPRNNHDDEGLVAEGVQYHQMQNCLYQHRKQWDKLGEPGKWGLSMIPRDYLDVPSHGPWQYEWHVDHGDRAPYKPPNPFSHDCSQEDCGFEVNNDKVPPMGRERDEYDYTIDFGDRRERLRKHFEWEMDRLYLSEETAQRRYAKAKEAEVERQREMEIAEAELRRSEDATTSKETAATTVTSDEAPEPEDVTTHATKEEESTRSIVPVFAKFEWFSFKRLSQVTIHDSTKVQEAKDTSNVCIIDVLVGDPVIRDRETNQWYGYSGRSRSSGSIKVLIPKAGVHSSAIPGQGILPERIRVRSFELIAILIKILGPGSTEGLGTKPTNTPAVFVRPFKTLLYCERAMRDWCNALEKKFSTLSQATAFESPGSGSKLGEPAVGLNTLEGPQSALIPAEQEKVLVLGQEGLNEPSNSSSAETDRQDSSQENPSQKDGDEETPKKHEGDSRGDKIQEKEGKQEDREEEDKEEEDDPSDITKSQTALGHLKCLLEFVDLEISARRAYIESPACTRVHYSDLWLLFRPGVEVIDQDGKQVYRVVEVNSAPHRAVPTWEQYLVNPASSTRTKSPFSITCVFIDFDGKHLGPVKKVFNLKAFEGEQDVSSLETYPLRFFQSRRSDFTESEWNQFEYQGVPLPKRFRQKLVARGAMFLDVVGVKHMYYAGPTLVVRDEIDSQVVVDFETAFTSEADVQSKWKPELNILLGTTTSEDEASRQQRSVETCRGGCCLDDFVYNDTHLEKKIRTDYIESLLPKERGEEPSVAIVPRPLKELDSASISDNELIIMSYRVFGFVLRSRKWAQLDLSFMSDVHPPETSKEPENQERGRQPKRTITSFDRLVLENGHRSMIESLVAQHFRDKRSSRGPQEQVDIVKGKGKGLILLLHGAPGVGKTSTAEGVAELFKKPLFQITCGDLGTTAREVEQALERNFTLASRWGCILLLDEADVFLAARTKEDFIRNGLVAAFLRVMEYYTGILFLTTNRVGDFDEAFTSRIHVSLYYPALNEDKTVGVFKINMEMIEERFVLKGRRINVDKMGIGSFASKHFNDHRNARWNGRQVRNACQTALALAEFEAQGNMHETILNPDAVVELGVPQFETVQRAYLEFSQYMHTLYGTHADRRAKEERLRAIWIDENDRVVATQGMADSSLDKRRAFVLGSQPQASQAHQMYQQPKDQHHQQPPLNPAAFGGIPPTSQQGQQPGYQYSQYSQYQYPSSTTAPFINYNGPFTTPMNTRQPLSEFQSFGNQMPSQTRWDTPPMPGNTHSNLNESGPSSISSQSQQHQHHQNQPSQAQPGQVLASTGSQPWNASTTPPAHGHGPQDQQQQQQQQPFMLSQGVQAMYAASARPPGSDYQG